MVWVIRNREFAIIPLSGLARNVKTFAKMEKYLGISISALDESKSFLGVVYGPLLTPLIRNLNHKRRKLFHFPIQGWKIKPNINKKIIPTSEIKANIRD